MRAVAVLVLGVALVAGGCGSPKPPSSAAEVAPGDAVAYVSLGRAPERSASRRALALLSGGAATQATLDRLAWARVAPAAEVAILGPHAAVAYALPHDRKALEKRLDASGLVRARIRGWTAFSPSASALASAKRARTRLAETAWFPSAFRSAGGQSSVLTHAGRDWTAVVLDGATVRRSQPGRGPADEAHRLAARIPANAVLAAGSHRFGADLRGLPYGALLERGVGLKLADLARATPRSAVLYAVPGEPFPPLTLLAEGGTLAAAARVVHELDPVAPAPLPVQLGGARLQHVAFGAVDLYYGRDGNDLVVTDDPAFDAAPSASLDPPGLPAATTAWVYLDARRGPAALESLAALAATPLSPSFLTKLTGLRSVLAYVTTTSGTRTTTLSVQ